MDSAQYAELIRQHNMLLGQLSTLWVMILVLVFVQIVWIAVMVIAAAYSVGRVTSIVGSRLDALQDRWTDMQEQVAELQRSNVEALQMIAKTIRGAIRP